MNRLKNFPLFAWIAAHRRLLGVIIIVLSLSFLVWYTTTHPEIIESVIHTSPLVLLTLLVLYLANVGVVFFINFFTVRICNKRLGVKEGIFLTIYSTVINFFGPLQSGPGVRAVYLKTKIGLRIRDYTLATLFYYFAFGAINASLLFISSWWWLSLLGFALSIVLIIIGTKKLHFSHHALDIWAIYLVSFVQVALTTAIYFTELHATGSNASLLHTIVYTASANLSLFVSLTPGGIGIREAFIVFTQSLHHISTASIISAGILDRAFYVLFLVLLFLASSAFHVRDAVAGKKNA